MLEELFKDVLSKKDKDKFIEIIKKESIYTMINEYAPEQRIDAIFFIDEKAKLVGAYKFWSERKKLKIKEVQTSHSRQMNITEFANQPIELFCGEWIASNADGIVKYRGNQEVRVGYQPLLITKRLINIDNNTEKFEIAYYDQNRWKTKYIPRITLSSSTSITKLVDFGIDITSSNAYATVNYLSDLYLYNKEKIPVVYSVSHLGWVGKDFKTFLPFVKSDIICDCEGETKKMIDYYSENGNQSAWLEMAKKCRKNDIVKIVMSASFASVLIKMVGINGFITHVYGDRGKGKTVLLMLAMSIWGNPDLGKLTNSINNTLFALEYKASFLQNLPFSGDELQNINKYEINNDALIYMIANGSGKGRGDRDGTIVSQSNWALNMITTGEDKITKDNSHSGSKVRCIEIENDEDIFDLNTITDLVNTIKENYGFAGREFIKYIISLGKDNVSERYKNIRDEFMRENGNLDGKQINAISLLKLANEISVECIFKDEEPIDDTVLLSLVKNEQEISVAERAKEYLLNAISMNKMNFLESQNEEFSPTRKEFWGYIIGNSYYINKNTVDNILKNGDFYFSEVKKKWGNMGFISEYKGRYYYWNDKYKANFVQITIPDSSIMNSDGESELPPF